MAALASAPSPSQCNRGMGVFVTLADETGLSHRRVAMTAAADFEEDDKGALRFSGSLTLGQLGDLPNRLAAIDRPPERIDLSQTEGIDTVGAWLVHRIARDHDVPIGGAS